MMHWMTLSRWTRRRPERRSALALALVAAGHGCVLIFIALWRGPTPAFVPVGVPVSLYVGVGLTAQPVSVPVPQIRAETPPADPAPPKISTAVQPVVVAAKAAALIAPPTVDPPKDLKPIMVNVTYGGPPPASAAASAAPVPANPAIASSASSGRKLCEILDVVQASLQTSPAVRGAIAVIPSQARSVANAVMIWDGRWAEAQSMGGDSGLGPIQKAVLDGINQAPPDCQGNIVRGPRLIAIGDQHDTTLLAFGSGEWRWSDLVATALQPQSAR